MLRSVAVESGEATTGVTMGHRQRDPETRALEALDEATRAIAGVLDLDEVLQLIVDRVRELVGARYAALGVLGGHGGIDRFITSGLTEAEREAIGPLPQGHGLLGLIIREGRTLRVDDIAAHPASHGFPPAHPPMTTLLGVPVPADGRPIGDLYLTDKIDGPFDDADERLVETFARHAGIAIVNAQLHAQARRLAVVEERDRIGRDLHDSIIQSLYAVSLSLEDVPELVRDAPDVADRRVDRAIDDLNHVIRDIRSFIHGLRPEALGGADLGASLAALAEEYRHNTLVEAELLLDRAADPGFDPDGNAQLLQIAREAMSNAARHSQARHVRMELRREAGLAVLEISDDGVGFDRNAISDPGHHGLPNMRARAEAIGGRLTIDSRPGVGTRVAVWMTPVAEAPGAG
jgi:signal transduction histidine kinase